MDGDLLAVSDLETKIVYQVAVINNGACLQGTVMKIVKLAQTAEPYGLAYNSNDLYVGNSGSNGGVLKVNLTNCEVTVVVHNGTVDCNTVHGIAVKNDGKIYFTDRENRKLFEIHNDKITVITGCEGSGSYDGSNPCSSFSQPTALCVEGNTIYVTNTSVGAIRMVTPCGELCKFLKELDALYYLVCA